MDTTRRGFLTSTVAATGAAVTQNLAHAADNGHDHQGLPSDPAQAGGKARAAHDSPAYAEALRAACS